MVLGAVGAVGAGSGGRADWPGIAGSKSSDDGAGSTAMVVYGELMWGPGDAVV